MDRSDRDGRDLAGVGPYARERENLASMSDLNWTFSDGEPDIRGWEVRTVSGRQLGAVSDLLIDRNEGEVVLLDIDLPGTDRHTFVPIRVVEVDRVKRRILMDSADIPETDLLRTDRGVVARAADTARTVRYPDYDREVTELPPQTLADRAAETDRAAEADLAADGDRRQMHRRRVDQLNHDADRNA